MAFRLNWKGDEVTKQVLENCAKAMGEFAMTAQANAMHQLEHGHGVETGTLRRSLHIAESGYDWGGDDVEPSSSSPNRNGMMANAAMNGKKVTIQLGSGLRYALPVHQGHHGFAGYHYLTIGLDQARSELPSILRKYRLRK